jgi:hypothetical protein
MGLNAFEVEIEAGEFHVRGFGDFDVALGAVNNVDIVAETFDEAGFIRGVDAIGSGAGEGFSQQFYLKNLGSLREDDPFPRDGGGD